MGCGVSRSKIGGVSPLSKVTGGSVQVNVDPLTIQNLSENRLKIYEAQKLLKSQISQKIPNATLPEEICGLLSQIRQEAFNQMRAWDEKRAQTIICRQAILDAIATKLDATIKAFHNGLEELASLFESKAKKISDYSSESHKKQLSTLFEHDKVQLFPNLVENFKQMDDMHKKNDEAFSEFGEYLKKHIVDDMLRSKHSQFKKEISSLHEKMHSLKKSLTSASNNTVSELDKYTKYFQASQKNLLKPGANITLEENDLYSMQLYVVETCKKEVEALKTFGEGVLDLWKEILDKDKKVIDSLVKALQEYQQRYVKVHGDQGLNAEVNIDSPFKIENILNEKDLNLLKKEIKKSEGDTLEIGDVESFFKDIDIGAGNNEILVVKNLEVKRDVALIIKEFKVCPCHLTVDFSLLVMDHVPGKTIEDYCFNMYHTALNRRKQKDRYLYDLVQNEPSSQKILLDLEDKEKAKKFKSVLK